MAVFNAAKREIDLKIVYYGPAMCGKTTNVQCIHKMLAPQQRGELMSLATKDDRTLFFDFLPIELGDVRGFKTRFHIYTVPGQVYYALTRRAVLTGADGVVFVVDSQANKLQDNIESLKDLAENLRFYKKDLTSFPFVLQYNKRDLPNVMPADELNAMLNTLNVPGFESSAVTGMGVVETLTAICKIVLKQMDSGTAKKKTLSSAVKPASRPMVTEDAGVHSINQNQAAAAPPPAQPLQRQPDRQVSPPPARPAQGIPSFSKQAEAPAMQPIVKPVAEKTPEAPALRMQPAEPAPPVFSDMNPLQVKTPSDFSPKFKDSSTSPGFSFADESSVKNAPGNDDASGLIFEEDEPELSFDDADSGLDFDEPAVAFSDTELSDADIEFSDTELSDADIELSDTDLPDVVLPDMELSDVDLLDREEPDMDLPEPVFSMPDTVEPELTFDDELDLLIEEPLVAGEPEMIEQDGSSLVLDDVQESDLPQAGQPAAAVKAEKPAFAFDDLPAFDDMPLSKPFDSQAQPGIVSCGQPQKISETVVKLPLTLRLKDNTEYPVTVTISIEDGLIKQ